MEIKNYAGGGASVIKKTLKAWRPGHYSAKTEVDRNLTLLRARAADLVKNSPIGAAAIDTMLTGVIGSGLKLYPRIKTATLGLSGESAREWARHTKEEFELWATNALSCDFLRRNNFAELQRITFASYLTDGDSFCLFRRRLPTLSNPYSLRLQIIEAGRVSNPNGIGDGVEVKRGDNRIINGIEVDRAGALSAIWIANRYWNEPSKNPELKWQRVRWYGRDTGCRNVLMIANDTRPDMNRGVPLLAPVIESIKQVSRYADAELSAAIVRSFFSVFFTQQGNLGVHDVLGAERHNEPCVDVSEYQLGSATMAALPPFVDVKAISSQAAQNVFDAFIGTFIKQIGAALGIPYEVLMKSFNASYSASRAALLQAADTFRQRRAAFIHDFLQPISEAWLSEAVAIGRIDAPGFDDPLRRQGWLAADWLCETTHALDSLKEAQAMQLKLANGLSTYRKELAENVGVDFDEVIETLTQERAMLRTVLDNRGAGD